LTVATGAFDEALKWSEARRSMAAVGGNGVCHRRGCNRKRIMLPTCGGSERKRDQRDEVDKYYRTRVNPEGQEPSLEESLSQKLNVLDELINNEILLEKAKKLNLEASDVKSKTIHRTEESVHRRRIQRRLKRSGHDRGRLEA